MSSLSDIDVKRDGSISFHETVANGAGDVYRPEVDISNVDERKLMRRIDIRLIPYLTLLYLLNSLDRGSIGNARVRVATFFARLCPLKSRTVVWHGGGYRDQRQAVSARAHSLLLPLLFP